MTFNGGINDSKGDKFSYIPLDDINPTRVAMLLRRRYSLVIPEDIISEFRHLHICVLGEVFSIDTGRSRYTLDIGDFNSRGVRVKVSVDAEVYSINIERLLDPAESKIVLGNAIQGMLNAVRKYEATL